jgi:hypothetical protein
VLLVTVIEPPLPVLKAKPSVVEVPAGWQESLLENLVFVELVRRGFSPNFELVHYQTGTGFEVALFRVGSG